MTKPKESFHFNPPIEIKVDWMIGLLDSEIYSSIFNITEENNKFELYNFNDEKTGGVSYEKVRDEIESNLDLADITDANLQDAIIGPINIKKIQRTSNKKNER